MGFTLLSSPSLETKVVMTRLDAKCRWCLPRIIFLSLLLKYKILCLELVYKSLLEPHLTIFHLNGKKEATRETPALTAYPMTKL
jgi:hypothetical protein